MTARAVVIAVASVMAGIEPLEAQASRRAWLPQPVMAEQTLQPMRTATQVRRDRAPSRGGYMFLGGAAGGLLGAVYAGVRVGSGDAEARKKVFVPPLIGIALGAAAGALWFEVTRAQR